MSSHIMLIASSDDGMDECHGDAFGWNMSDNDSMEENIDSIGPHDCGTTYGMFSNFGKESEAIDEYWEIVQMTFESEEQCYNFYNSYAEKKGFNVRKDILRREKKVGDIFYSRFVCFKEGSRDPANRDIKDRKRRERAETREHCTTELSIRLDKARGVWFVDNFLDDHNHILTNPDETRYLRSHRKMKDYQKSEIMMYESKGIRKHHIMDVFECTHGDKVGFIEKDIYNFSSRYKRSRIKDGDANATLAILKARRDKDPEFFFDHQVDSEGHLKNLFWCDGQSRMDYQSFGDVVVFDSTYRMNRYKMPFVLPNLPTRPQRMLVTIVEVEMLPSLEVRS